MPFVKSNRSISLIAFYYRRPKPTVTQGTFGQNCQNVKPQTATTNGDGREAARGTTSVDLPPLTAQSRSPLP
jgi:hypothetical protein